VPYIPALSLAVPGGVHLDYLISVLPRATARLPAWLGKSTTTQTCPVKERIAIKGNLSDFSVRIEATNHKSSEMFPSIFDQTFS
jgi:hypothetical protein